MQQTEFLIVGAGPYGLAAAAYAKATGLQAVIVGKPLELWKTGMPRGMFLRSGPDWHLDAREVATFEAYVTERGLTPRETKPLPINIFLDYVSWFMGRYDIVPRNAHVTHLARSAGGAYVATLDDGSRISAANVLLALGFGFFKHLPHDLTSKLPPGSYSHTADSVDFDYYRNKRVLIIGGRQSAYEWAALIRERGADQIHLTHRHAEPRFVEPDWSWVQPMARRALVDHSWWRRLPIGEQVRVIDDFWATGRLTLEPWLDERVHQPNVHIHERTKIASVDEDGRDQYDVVLDDGSRLNVHRIILATGYLPDMRNVAILDRATILDRLRIVDGFPALDSEFQTSLTGLYVTGLAATRDFGPFFSVTVGCAVAARIIGDAVGVRAVAAV